MIKINEILEQIKNDQAKAFAEWKEANDKYDDDTYCEEFEDTLQRKYDEGYADALQFVIELFAKEEEGK